jgi:hypothetical protein
MPNCRSIQSQESIGDVAGLRGGGAEGRKGGVGRHSQPLGWGQRVDAVPSIFSMTVVALGGRGGEGRETCQARGV